MYIFGIIFQSLSVGIHIRECNMLYMCENCPVKLKCNVYIDMDMQRLLTDHALAAE